MKLTPEQVKLAYDRLSSDPSTTIRKLAKELHVSDVCLGKRLKEYAGSKYAQFNPPQGSLLKLLRTEIVPSLDPIQKKEVNQWIQRHCHELMQDNGLLTSSQEDRLTYTECMHHRALEEMIPLSEFLSDRIESGYIYLPIEDYVDYPEEEEESRPSSKLDSPYIDLQDLQEVLADHFKGCLDDVLPKLTDRLYRSTLELHPSNTLWGQVTSEMIQECLDELSIEESVALKFHFDHSLESEAALLNSFYYSEYSDFTVYSEEKYFNGLNHISDHLLRLL